MKYLNLASGASYFASPATATEAAIQALQQGKTKYSEAAGTISLREAIAARYQTQASIKPEHVLVTPGVKQALFNLFSVLLTQDTDELLVPTPAWFGFHELMKYSKGKLVTIKTLPDQKYNLTPEALEAALTENTRILLLSNPANPTGRIYTRQELEALLEVAARYPNLYIISDEIYDLVTYGEPVTSLLSCQGKADRCIVINGFSKSFAMSGWRIGYILAADHVIAMCSDFQKSTLSGLSEFVQDGAEAALQFAADDLPAKLAILKSNRSILAGGLNQIPGLNFFHPDGAYYIFADFSAYLNRTTPTDELLSSSIALCSYLKEKYKLELSPGDYFGAPGFARLSFAIEQTDLEEAIIRLKTALASLVI